MAGIASAAASKRSRSKPKKSTEIDRNDSEAVVGDKKKGKSRSTSRGVLNRFKSAKDESDVEKKETDVNGTESKSEEPTITDEVAAAAPVTAIAGAIGLTHTGKSGFASCVSNGTDIEQTIPTMGQPRRQSKPIRRQSSRR